LHLALIICQIGAMGDNGQRLGSIDRRIRSDADAVPVAPEAFVVEQLPDLLGRHGDLVADGIRRLGLRPLAFDLAGSPWSATLGLDGDGLSVRPGIGDDALVLDVDEAQFSDFVLDQRSLNSFSVARDVRMHNASMTQILDWDRVWRALLDGWAVHRPGDIDFGDRDGSPLDLHQGFGPDDDPADIAHFLREAGFVRLEGWLDPADMATIADDIERALPSYRPDDGRSWWATLSNGEERCVRLLHFVEHSETTARVLGSEAWDRLRTTVAGDDTLERGPITGNIIEALIKPLGVTQGISDIPWHRDCSLGRHSYKCCGITVGVSVSDGGADRGQLRAVAGSHRANVPALGVQPELDLPVVGLPTRAGDLTVHVSCTLHEATPPLAAERTVMYTGFGLPARPSAEDNAAAARAWERRNQAHKLQSQPPSPVSAS
jgi:hypothetical protein